MTLVEGEDESQPYYRVTLKTIMDHKKVKPKSKVAVDFCMPLLKSYVVLSVITIYGVKLFSVHHRCGVGRCRDASSSRILLGAHQVLLILVRLALQRQLKVL